MILIFPARLIFAKNENNAKVLAVQFGLPSLDQSIAYQGLLQRPITEVSKINYLIERFKDSNAEIDYGGHYYNPKDISRFVQMFIVLHYDEHETARDWILKYANRSIPKGEPIWIRLSNGRFCQSKDVLMGELDDLEKALVKNSKN